MFHVWKGLAVIGPAALVVAGLVAPGVASADAPSTVPAFVTPSPGATLSGTAAITVTTSAERVRIDYGATTIGYASAAAGTATLAWPTWGWAEGAFSLLAYDCDALDVCAVSGTSVGVTLDNVDPVLTAPSGSPTLTGPAVFSATAPGGGVGFLVDGVNRGFDGSSPYSVTVDMSVLTDGVHSLTAIQCNADGTRCEGAQSASEAFTAASLHPVITGQAPNPFSPNGDKVKDTTTTTYALPDPETVTWRVLSATGTVIRGPIALGTKAAGSYTYVWNGLTNAATRAPNATYTVVITTSGSGRQGRAERSLKLDTAAPTMTGVLGAGATFYPVVDRYKDTFSPSVVLNEAATLTLTVRTTRGVLVRSISASRPAGRAALSWNGRSSKGVLVPQGTYRWTYTAVDPAANTRTTAAYTVVVSLKRLVSTTFTITVKASARIGSWSSRSCAYVRKSDYGASGLWLYNGCNYNTVGRQYIEMGYRAVLPAAISYGRITVKAYGHTHAVGGFQPISRVYGWIDKADRKDWALGYVDVRSTVGRMYSLASVASSGYVGSGRRVYFGVGVADYWTPPPNDFDVRSLSLVVTAKVLR